MVSVMFNTGVVYICFAGLEEMLAYILRVIAYKCYNITLLLCFDVCSVLKLTFGA